MKDLSPAEQKLWDKTYKMALRRFSNDKNAATKAADRAVMMSRKKSGGGVTTSKAEPEATDFEIRGEISKIDEDARQAFGWAYVSLHKGKVVVDHSGEAMPVAELEKGVYPFVKNIRDGGAMHEKTGAGEMIESIVFTDEKVAAMGLPEDSQRGWWVGFEYSDEAAWQGIKDGTYPMFSIHGKGLKRQIEKAGWDPKAHPRGRGGLFSESSMAPLKTGSLMMSGPGTSQQKSRASLYDSVRNQPLPKDTAATLDGLLDFADTAHVAGTRDPSEGKAHVQVAGTNYGIGIGAQQERRMVEIDVPLPDGLSPTDETVAESAATEAVDAALDEALARKRERELSAGQVPVMIAHSRNAVAKADSWDELEDIDKAYIHLLAAEVATENIAKGVGPNRHGPSIKCPDIYEALKREGKTKTQAAKISNQCHITPGCNCH